MKAFALLLLLVSPAAAGGPYYLTIVKAGCEAPAACREDSYGALEKMVQLADAQGVKLTLFFSDAYAQFLSSVPARQQSVQDWKAKGHEVGAWQRAQDPALRSYEPVGRAGVAAAKKQFAAMKGGVYSAAFTASPESFGAYYAWLGFLKENDAAGARSRTAAGAAAEKLLRRKKEEAAVRPVKKDGAARILPARPGLPAVPVAADNKAEGTPIPKMVPKPSRFSLVERLFFGHRGGGRDFRPGSAPSRQAENGYLPGGIPAYLVGRCGDGICQPRERCGPTACPKDCK